MKLVTKNIWKAHKNKYIQRILSGGVFIYPTDTIYGIGCVATNPKAVKKIQRIKKRTLPFSIIAPSKAWIRKYCRINDAAKKWLQKLPGCYTLILPLKSKRCIAKEVNNNMETIGVRIPKHWIAEVVKEIKKPIVTTSVNVHGKPYMTAMENLDRLIKKSVDFIIYEGAKKSSPSKIIVLTGNKAKIVNR